MAQSKSGKKTNQSKLTRQQRANRVKAAQERERLAQIKREQAERTKKIFTVVVCIILVLALGIPTVALMGLNL